MKLVSMAAAMVLAATLFMASGAQAWVAEPASPQPEAAALKPGLAVTYYYSRFEHIDELESAIRRGEDATPGGALPTIDYKSGAGRALTSSAADLVGAHITGYVHFDKPGTWTLMVTSNDGVRLTVGGAMLHEDPEIHGDTDSPPLKLDLPEAGWYPIEILYYEKKGTSTLKLYWQPPGGTAMAIIPADALRH